MKGYWHEIRLENCNEMYFRESKVCNIASKILSILEKNIECISVRDAIDTVKVPNLIPPKTSPQANPVAKITVSQSWPPFSKWKSDTQQIGDVKKQIFFEWKLVFHFNTCHFIEWIYKFSLCLV